MLVNETDAHKTMCPWNEFKGCYGSRCMAWAKAGRSEDRITTNNIIVTDDGERPEGEPQAPPGEGWLRDGEPMPCGYANRAKLKLPHGLQQEWVRPRTQPQGTCGRVHGGYGF